MAEVISNGSNEQHLSSSSSSSRKGHTTAANRRLSDLHAPTWLALAALSAAARTAVQHPLNLAATRKRVLVSNRPVTVVSMVRDTLKAGGVRGAYRGFGLCITGSVVGEVSYLFTLEALKEALLLRRQQQDGHDRHGHGSGLVAAAVDGGAGMGGELVAALICTPFSVVINRQFCAGFGTSASEPYLTAAGTVRRMLAGATARGAVRKLYAGFSTSIFTLPASGVWWAVYSHTKRVLYASAPSLQEKWRGGALSAPSVPLPLWGLGSSTDNPLLNAAASGVASAVAGAAFNPVMVVRTRLQTLPDCYFSSSLGKSSNFFSRSKIVTLLRDMWRVEGPRGFMKGATANVGMWVADGFMFTFLFEGAKMLSDTTARKQGD